MIEAGIYLVNKRRGETSFVHVQRFLALVEGSRPRLRVCHAGALDPFAEGLLIVLVGPVTRTMELFHPIPKTYVAEIAWGAETDNGDPTGSVVARGDASTLTPEAIEAALAEQLGWREQVPPATSNKRVDGERAWQRAHRGEPVVLPPSRVFLHSVRVLEHQLPQRTRIELTCRGGYYVRSLARDVGRALGARGHLLTLRRHAIGPYSCPDAEPPVLADDGLALSWLPERTLTAAEVKRLTSGQPIDAGVLQPPSFQLPAGFPTLDDPVCGVFAGRRVVVLHRTPAGFELAATLVQNPIALR